MITRKIIDLPFSITCIDTGLIRPKLAACYLLLQGEIGALVDTGCSHSVETILNVLKYKDVPVENIRYVMPTHVHLDHASGAGYLLQQLPNAQLVIHPRGARHMIDPSKLQNGAMAVYGEEAMYKMFGELIPVDENRILIADDGFKLDLNGRRLTFIDTPGHARHHYSIFDEQSKGFFSGDTFGLSYQELYTEQGPSMIPTTSPIQFDPTAWYATIDRYLSYQPQRMFLTHYGMVENVETLAAKLREGIDYYVTVAEKFADVPDRHKLIKNTITDYALGDLKEMGCRLPAPACRGVLEMDMELNAQGLEIWIDKNRIKD